MTSVFTTPLELEKMTLNPFDLAHFRKFLIDNKVIASSISFASATYLESVTTSFFDNIIIPIITKENFQKFEDYTLNINGIKIKIGKFIIDIFKYFMILYILFLISRLTRDIIN